MVKILLGILIVVGIIFGYVQYKFYTVEHTVIKYLTAKTRSRKRIYYIETVYGKFVR